MILSPSFYSYWSALLSRLHIINLEFFYDWKQIGTQILVDVLIFLSLPCTITQQVASIEEESQRLMDSDPLPGNSLVDFYEGLLLTVGIFGNFLSKF